jgi:hypothetical protein
LYGADVPIGSHIVESIGLDVVERILVGVLCGIGRHVVVPIARGIDACVGARTWGAVAVAAAAEGDGSDQAQ